MLQIVEKYNNAFEHKCYRRDFKLSWTEKRANKSLLQELQIEESWLLKEIKQTTENQVFWSHKIALTFGEEIYGRYTRDERLSMVQSSPRDMLLYVR
jgi:hypothetical protein